MRLSPLDISKQEFGRTLRGYDPAEVRAFLEKVADELADLEAQASRLSQQNLKVETQLEGYKQIEVSLRESLVTAKKSLEEARESTKREQELMLREAQLEAERMVQEARHQVHTVREELGRLTIQRDAYLKRLRFLLSSQQELIEILEKEPPLSDTRHERTTQED